MSIPRFELPHSSVRPPLRCLRNRSAPLMPAVFVRSVAMLLEGSFTTRIYEMRDEYLRRKAAKEAGKEE